MKNRIIFSILAASLTTAAQAQYDYGIRPLSEEQQEIKHIASNIKMLGEGPVLTLFVGRPIAQQFSDYGKQTGWTLIWQAPEFELEQTTAIVGDFETAIASFLKSANESGSRLRAAFYRGNKTVRIEEF